MAHGYNVLSIHRTNRRSPQVYVVTRFDCTGFLSAHTVFIKSPVRMTVHRRAEHHTVQSASELCAVEIETSNMQLNIVSVHGCINM